MIHQRPSQLTLPLHMPRDPVSHITPPLGKPALADVLGKDFSNLAHFPAITPAEASRHAPQIGLAGESLVTSWAARRGLAPVSMPAGAPFDHIFTVGPHLVRAQTKTTTGPRRDGRYSFNMSRGNSGDPNGTSAYASNAFDLAALVFLDLGVIYFTTEKKSRFRFTTEEAQLMAHIEFECFCDCLLQLAVIDRRAFDILTNEPDCEANC